MNVFELQQSVVIRDAEHSFVELNEDEPKGSKWYAPWQDVPIVRSNVNGREVTVCGLLPGTRYRFRQRCRDNISWDKCPISRLFLTDRT